MSIKIYTQVPKEFEKKVKSGEIVRTGVTLRDANTGKIVGHLEVVEKSDTERGKQIIAQTAKVGIKVSGEVIKFTANTMGVAIQGASSIIGNVASGVAIKGASSIIGNVASGVAIKGASSIIGNVASGVVSAGLNTITAPLTGATLVSSFIGNIQNVFIHKDVKATKKIAQETLEISKETLERVKGIESSLSGLQTCNWITTGLSAVNLGVSVVGFSLVMNKLGKIQKQLNDFNMRFDTLDQKLDILIQVADEHRNLNIKQYHERFVCLYRQCVDNLGYLSEPKFMNENTLRDIKKLLNEIYAFLLSSISLFKDGYSNYISLDDIFTLLLAFTQLGIAYSTQYYKMIGHQDSCFTNQYSGLYKNIFCKQVFESLKQSYMINSNKLLTADDYTALYESLKYQIYNLANSFKSHEELLASIKYEDFLKEQDLASQLVSEDGNAIVLYDDWDNES